MLILRAGAALFVVAIAAAAIWLWTPAGRFDREAARQAAAAYDARIIRDAFGVPHIYGARDADVAFGLAYAHAEDDWATIEEVLRFSRGELARSAGKDGAITDYLIAALSVWRDIDAKYESDLSADTRALLEGYAAGFNLWCAEDSKRCGRGVAPVTAKDVVAGFASRTPFFYGLDEKLTALFEGDAETHAMLEERRLALLHLSPGAELGSNAMAVAGARSADGHTRLMVNSHQPYTGPVAWYEARVKSGEGWDMIGGVFPGSPVILHGASPHLGWAHTVNKPDLVDVYRLDVDDPRKPAKYRFEGEWRDLETSSVTLRVKLFGPFALPVSRPLYRSVHGPVFVTDSGVYAVSYGGAGDVRTVEQWYRMNRATNFDEWRAAMEMQAIPSFNAIYADADGHIAYFYNAAIPVRSENQNWARVADGGRADLLWDGVRPFGSAPSVVDPASGYIVNANHTPFEASGEGDNPDPAGFPPHYGIDVKTTNRGLRIQQLYGGDSSITEEEFLDYKMDDRYADGSRLRQLIAALLADEAVRSDMSLAPALEVLQAWDGRVGRDTVGAPLAIETGRRALSYLLDRENISAAEIAEALRSVVADFEAGFGRVDLTWSDVVRLRRGEIDIAIDGGPDTLRAVYPDGDPAEGTQKAVGGDTYILYADWPAPGAADRSPEIRTIHQFGAATLDETSPHYADQAPIFAAEKWKTPPMDMDALLAEATRDYRPGR